MTPCFSQQPFPTLGPPSSINYYFVTAQGRMDGNAFLAFGFVKNGPELGWKRASQRKFRVKSSMFCGYFCVVFPRQPKKNLLTSFLSPDCQFVLITSVEGTLRVVGPAGFFCSVCKLPENVFVVKTSVTCNSPAGLWYAVHNQNGPSKNNIPIHSVNVFLWVFSATSFMQRLISFLTHTLNTLFFVFIC